jgi:enediyne biosynthesis protein E4
MPRLALPALLLCAAFFSCKNDPAEHAAGEASAPSGPALFEKMPAERTGIDFANRILDEEKLNPITFNYVYMSGAVGVGDFNNDGLTDLYFSASTGPNRLYLNRGDFKFEDVAVQAGVAAPDGLKTGVTVVDINNDGWLDIYQCRTSSSPDPASRSNLLFINMGANSPSTGGGRGEAAFTEQSVQYGLDAHCPSTHANFFDYDRDGDLDMYLVNHRTDFSTISDLRAKQVGDQIVRITEPEDAWTSDRLYRNEGTGRFTDVSQKAGIQNYTYGLSATIVDANRDGWPDVYVGNDYIEPDNLFINNRNGTFTDRVNDYMRHLSTFSMGADLGDINNDGLADLLVLDMAPEYNRKQKTTATSMVPERYNTLVSYGYGHQMMRNMLQLNNGDGTYSEIGCLAGVAATDWSWAPLLVDFDLDGYRDLFISNGHRRDVNDLDYNTYTIDSLLKTGAHTSNPGPFLKQMPREQIHNYMYRNRGDLTFENMTAAWGFSEKTLSNSAVYADLDNDGDQDIVVVNGEKPAFIYRNKAVESGMGHYLQVRLEGPAQNLRGIGAQLLLEAGGQRQIADATPIRGYISTSTDIVQFGLGKNATAEKLHIQWPDGKVQTLENLPANQRLTLRYTDAQPGPSPFKNLGVSDKPLFADITQQIGLQYKNRENNFNDFGRERLMPHSFSNQGPSLAVADVNADGLDDFYTGGCFQTTGTLGIQQSNGRFALSAVSFAQDTLYEDTDALFFDANGDSAPDLFVVSGSNEAPLNSKYYQDRLYLNDGKGRLTYVPDNIPKESESGGCAAAHDYDGDGDLDLFVGGRVVPGAYPRLPFSSVLQNDGKGRFSNVTPSVAPELSQIGMVTAIIFADLDRDGTDEMLVTGEWMPIEVFKNQGGKFVRSTAAFGLDQSNGWWNELAAADLDGDGDLDLAAGNLGLNTRYRATPAAPLRLWAKDFDNNGSLDPLMGWYEGGKCRPVPFRDQIIKQVPALKKKFIRYATYADATVEDVFPKNELETAQQFRANELRSCWFENQGGKMLPRPLPNEAQMAPVRSIVVHDFDQNGSPDLLLAGNDYGLEVETGRVDAGNGTLLLNDGKGNFRPMPNWASGFWAKKDARNIRLLRMAGGKQAVMVANNADALQVFGRK